MKGEKIEARAHYNLTKAAFAGILLKMDIRAVRDTGGANDIYG
ncbi:MAG TPA: hypothetical protein PKW41_03205 [Clostridia bacterium]|jgi:hypothetical protein|nr:hypothetical protein [Clostridia bacterium]HPK14976.1 hypothetical protein [Clostridia bacterium]